MQTVERDSNSFGALREMFAISLTVHNAHTSDPGILTSWELHFKVFADWSDRIIV